MFRLLLSFACLLPFVSAVSLHCNSPLPPKHGQLMTDDHYDILLSLFLDERKHRMQLQQYVLNLEAKVDNLSQQYNNCLRVSTQQPVIRADNVTQQMETKYDNLVLKFESMELKLKQELATSKNKTSMLEEEVVDLKTANQLHTLGNVQQEIQTLKAGVRSLVGSNQARSKDIQSMYSDLNENKQRINVLESNSKSLENNQIMMMDNITTMDNYSRQQVMVFESNINSLEINQRVILANMKAIDNNQTKLKAQIHKAKEQSQEKEEYVGFTAFGASSGTRSSGYQLKFQFIKSSIGISNLSSMKNNGTFICEKKGLYLIVVTVMVCSKGDSAFRIYKNNQQYMYYFIGRSDHSKEDCHSGTGTAVVELHVNDALNVRNVNDDVRLFESYSSFSAVKLK
ncbi:unnamed protein product [Mytilus coruscus]|uniref:C1q domain-containing protein n=1 Tax=Mytilus coruscus TaxID=42192 RepID=A0A6J8D181_MYTCO|nr:unnamed protein product [Mytilus coruscus]